MGDTAADISGAGRRRGRDRRRRSAFVFRERRTGFDRRGASQGTLARGLLQLRDSRIALLALLAAVNVMNVLDQLATMRALSAGFTESNPVMAALIGWNPTLAAVVKVTAVLGVSVGVWSLRRYRAILQVAMFMFAVFAVVLLIHFWGSAFYY